MKHLISRRYSLRILTVLLTISLGAFVVARFSAAASSVLFGSHTTQKGAITARAENLDEPWVKLQPSRSVRATYRDAAARKDGGAQTESATRSLDGARPLSLGSNDFNADGFPDLVCGYATSSGGLVSIQRGNPASYAPEDPEVLGGIGRQQFPDPFMPEAGYVELPERPDFLGTVDFNRDGQMDIVAATRGSDGMYLLAGDGHGGFAPPQRIALPGVVTAMTTGKIDQADGTTSVILGLNIPGGSSLMIYEGKPSLLETTPVNHSLPAEVTSLGVGRLDDDQFDDVGIVAGGQVFILHGHGQSQADEIFADRMGGKIEAINLPFAVQGMGVGTFIWSRDGAQQMALLGDDGAVHIAAHGQLDTRPFTADEVSQKRQALEETRVEMQLASREGKAFLSPESERPAPKTWGVVEDLATPAGKSFAATAAGSDSVQSTLASPILLSTRISTLPSDDLLIMNPAAGEFQISYNESSRPGVAQANPGSPQRSAVALDTGSEPVAVLPMRVSVDGRPGLVVLTKDSAAPQVIVPLAAQTYHVTGVNADATTACVGTNCTTLRAAIIASNANAGADTIVFDVNGTFTLSIVGNGNDTTGASIGDLDVNDSLTITGNGSANTIISTSYNSACGDCKVFGVNQDGTHINQTISFTGMTIQNGVNNGTCGTFFDTGGGVDFFLTGTTVAGNSYSITNSIIQNNQIVANCGESHGGGLNVDSTGQAVIGGNNIGTVTLTGDTFQGNSATHEGGGLTLAADKHDVTMTTCTVGGPLVANGNQSGGTAGVGGGIWTRHSFGGTLTINGGSFQNNKASSTVLDANGVGGAITISGNQVTNIGVTTGVTFTSNSALESGGGTAASLGGGIAINNLGAAGVTGSTQISNSTINSNHADNGAAAQGGGIYFNAKYSGTVSNCSIGNGGANTSARGAGVFNGGGDGTTSLTINSGTTITSNAATGPGGGIANVDSVGGITILNGITIDSNTAGSGGSGIDMTTDVGGTGSSMTLQGTMNLNGGNGIFIGRGTLTSTAGTLNLSGDFKRDSTGTFTHNGGTVNFNGGGAQNINGTATSETFNNFTVNKGNTLTVGGSTTSLTMAGNVLLTAGGFNAGTATGITLNTGSWTNNGGTFTPASSVVSFTNTGAGQNINGSATTQTFNGITVAKTAQILAVGGSTTTLTLNGSMTLTSGTFDKGTATAINVAGNWTNNGGTFTTSGAGTVTFNGGGAQNLNGSAGTQTFNNFTVSKGGGTLTGGGGLLTLTLTGNMSITAGTFAAGTITTINDPGDWGNAGTFTAGSSTVNLTGNNNTQTLTGSTTFNNLTINHTGINNVTASGSTLAVSGLLRVQSGTFISSSTFNNVQIDSGTTLQSDGGQMNVAGNWTNNGGTFTPTGNTVNFNGGGAQAINGSALSQAFNNVIVNKGGGTLIASVNILTVNDFTLTAGTFTAPATMDINGNTVLTAGTYTAGGVTTAAGNWTNNGATFTASGGTVTFDGGAGQTIGGTTATTFNNLTNSDAGGIAMNNDNTVNGILALTSSDITVASTKTLTQPSTAGASTGTFDVIGSVRRTGANLPNTPLTYGNPDNVITLAGSTLTSLTVNLTKSVPTSTITGIPNSGWPFSVQRTYLITEVPSGAFTPAGTTLQLHYLTTELNGNSEATPGPPASLRLYRYVVNNPSTGWQQQDLGGGNTTLSANHFVKVVGIKGFSPWTMANSSPTAAPASIGGTITDASGAPISGATINLSGTESRETITDTNGNYGFDNVAANGFYTVTPARVNYSFSPANRSFSLLGVHTEASFTASANGDHANAIDTTEFFVRQQYLDFLGREPDPPGFTGWVNTINNCAAGDASCDRVHVSEMFFRSEEFQQRGYFVYRFYSTAFGQKPDYAAFAPDLGRVSGFLDANQLEAAKTAFANDFVNRPAFAPYATMNNAQYVDALSLTAGVTLSNRQALIDSLNAGTLTRAAALRQIAESNDVYAKYYNQAFVVMEYFGYLRRDPDILYLNWIDVLNQGGDSRHMVEGFVDATEYRNRFKQ